MKSKAQKRIMLIVSALVAFGFAYSANAIAPGEWDLFDDYVQGSLDLTDLGGAEEQFLDLGGTSPTGYVGGNPTAAQNAVNNLSEANLQIVKQTAQELEKIQQDDFEACKAEADGAGGGMPGGGGGMPGGGGGGSNPGGSGTSAGNEQEVRQALDDRGVDVKKQPCNGRDYNTVAGGCTDVQDLPQHSINRLGEINDEMGGGVILTGGTEAGHSPAHAPGNNTVDLSLTPQVAQYVDNHTVGTYPGELGTYHILDTGDIFLREGNHWHVRFDGSASAGSGGNAIITANQNGFQLVKNKVQSFFTWIGKKIKRISLVSIVNADSSVNLGGNLIDPSNISTERLQEIISGMSRTQINQDFSQISSSALSDLMEQMSFNSINTVFNNLSGANVNNIVSSLGGDAFNNVAHLLVEPSVNNIFSNMSVTGFDSLLDGMGDSALNSLISSLDQSGIDNMLMRANDDIINQVFGNLGNGSINTILSGGSEDLIRGMMNSLGQGNIEHVFESVGISTAGKLIESVGADFLNEVIPDMSSLGLDTVFGNLGSGDFGQLFDNITGENWDQVFSQLGGAAAGDLVASLGSDMMDGILPMLGDGAVGNLFENIGGDALGMLVDGISTGNLNDIFESLGPQAINHTLQALGDGFGGILPNLTDNALGNLLLGGDNSILQAALSGAPEDIVAAALDKVPDSVLQQVSDIPVVGEFLGGGAGGVLGGAAGLITGAGLYVPVVEQQGQLMTAAQNTDKQTASIDKTTQEIRDLSIQICTHLRAIRRIQTRFELIKMADETNANRTRLEALAKYANDVAGKDNPDSLIKTGYTTIVNGSYVNIQVFPKNLDNHLSEVKEEAKQVVLADIKNSNNLYKEKLAELIEDESASQIDSTVTKEDIEKFRKTSEKGAIKTAYAPSFASRLLAYLPSFVSRPLSKLAFWKSASAQGQPANTNSSSATDFWNMWFKITDPENNPYGSAMLAMEAKERAQNTAEARARDEYLAGQGILPSGRKCVDEVKDENGQLVACRKWEVVAGEGAPGIVVKETLSSALLAKYNSYLVPGGPESQPEGSAPDAHENATGNVEAPTKPSAGPGQNTKPGSGPDGQQIQVIDPNKTEQTVRQTQQSNAGSQATGGFGGGQTNPSGGGGTTPGGSTLNWNDLLAQLMGMWNNNDGTGDSSSTQSSISILLALAQSAFQSQPPLVQTKVLSPTLADINAGRKPNQIKLVWASPNSTCKTTNVWLRGSDSSNQAIKQAGDSLGRTGNQIIALPIKVDATLSIENGEVVNSISPEKTPSSDLMTESLIFSLDSVSSNSEISLTLENNKIEIQANSPVNATEILKAELEKLNLSHAYSISTRESSLVINSTTPTYQMICKNSNGEVAKSFIIERQ